MSGGGGGATEQCESPALQHVASVPSHIQVITNPTPRQLCGDATAATLMDYSGEVVSFISLRELPLLRASCPPGFPATGGNVQRPPHCSRQPGLTSA